MATVEFYRDLARSKIMELIEQEHALLPFEINAKLNDRPVLDLPPRMRGIDQHHLQPAWRSLVREGYLERDVAPTRGGREVAVLVPADRHRRRRAVADASSRKRLLQARYLGWASGTSKTEGIIGPAGERVVHQALLAAAPAGYRLVNPLGTGQTSVLFNQPVPIGPLDNAAYLTTLDAAGFPSRIITVPVEVKNVRDTLYPGDQEVHQLLAKSALLQLAHPDRDLLPVLVCRRAHYTTLKLADTLGFYVISTKEQFLPTHLDPAAIAEIVDVLGYDLVARDHPEPALVRHFGVTVQHDATRRADTWRATSSEFGDLFAALRPDLRYRDREYYRAELLERAGLKDTTAGSDDGEGDGASGWEPVPW